MKHLIRKMNLSIITCFLVLVVTATTTYAWTGILSYSSVEAFDVGLLQQQQSNYSLQISLDGINFNDYLKMVDLKRSILIKMGYDVSGVSDETVEDTFNNVRLNPVTTKRTGANLGKFVTLEDITTKDFVYDTWTETEYAKSAYFDFDIYLSFECILNDPSEADLNYNHNVYLSNVKNMITGSTRSVGLANPYTFSDYFPGENITSANVNVTSASRLAVTKYAAVERGNPTLSTQPLETYIFQGGSSEPTFNNGVYSFGGIMNENNNIAFTEYNTIHTDKQVSVYFLNEILNSRKDAAGFEDAIAIGDYDAEGKWIIDNSDGLNTKTMIKLNVKLWMEGFDGDCFEVIAGMPVALRLMFSTKKDD